MVNKYSEHAFQSLLYYVYFWCRFVDAHTYHSHIGVYNAVNWVCLGGSLSINESSRSRSYALLLWDLRGSTSMHTNPSMRRKGQTYHLNTIRSHVGLMWSFFLIEHLYLSTMIWQDMSSWTCIQMGMCYNKIKSQLHTCS